MKFKVYVILLKLYIIYTKIFRKFNKDKPFEVTFNNRKFIVSGSINYKLLWKVEIIFKWEKETFQIFDKFLKPDKTYIDIGAFIGETILYAGQIAKEVHAIEPDPIAFDELKHNVSLNPSFKDRIKLHKICLNDHSGKVKFGNMVCGGDSMSSLTYPNPKTSWTVEGLTFNDFLEKNRIKDCSFIKMDIEGSEIIVLPTMKAYLEKNKPDLYLSMHPPMFYNIHDDTLKLIDILSMYKNIYNIKGEKISPKEWMLKQGDEFYAVLATDKQWN